MSGPTSEVGVSRTVSAPVERVWAVLTDIHRAPEILSGVDSVHVLTEGPYGLGTRWRETRTMMGRTETQEMWVSDNDPLRRTEVRAEDKGVAYVTELSLGPVGGGATELGMTFRADASGAGRVLRTMTTVLGPLGARITRKALARDLADIAAAAERG